MKKSRRLMFLSIGILLLMSAASLYSINLKKLTAEKLEIKEITFQTSGRIHASGKVSEQIVEQTSGGEEISKRDRDTLYFIDDDGNYSILENSLFYPDRMRTILTNKMGMYIQDENNVWYKQDSWPGPSPVLTLKRIELGSDHIKKIKKLEDGYLVNYQQEWIKSLPFEVLDEGIELSDFSVTLKLSKQLPVFSDRITQEFALKSKKTGEITKRKHELILELSDRSKLREIKNTIDNKYNDIKDIQFRDDYAGNFR